MKKTVPLLLLSLTLLFFSCGQQPRKEAQANNKDTNNDRTGASAAVAKLSKGKGLLTFKMDGQLYETDPKRTKCWTTTSVPLAMLMANGNAMSISWQMGYEQGKDTYKLDGHNGSTNFTIGGKTYWTRSLKGDNYLNIIVTSVKNKYSLILLSGTFEGVLEDKEGNKVQITEGKFVTEDI
jgi:hypothetical protein